MTEDHGPIWQEIHDAEERIGKLEYWMQETARTEALKRERWRWIWPTLLSAVVAVLFVIQTLVLLKVIH